MTLAYSHGQTFCPGYHSTIESFCINDGAPNNKETKPNIANRACQGDIRMAAWNRWLLSLAFRQFLLQLFSDAPFAQIWPSVAYSLFGGEDIQYNLHENHYSPVETEIHL